jgi:hypothetical protein
VQSLQVFEKAIFETNKVYTIYIAGVGYTLMIERSIIAIMKINNFINEKTLSAEIVDLINIFN